MSANQDDDYTISGWTPFFDASPSTGIGWYKFAGAGESTTINITWTTGGTSQGGIHYYEFSGADTTTPIAYAAGSVGLTSVTSLAYGAHDIPQGTFAIQLNHTGDNAVTASINDGYAILGISGNSGQRSRSAYKSYTQGENGVNPTWTYSASDDFAISIIGINGLKQ